MQRHRTSSGTEIVSGLEPRQVIAIVGLILTGVLAAVTLPLWVAAICMLLALGAIGIAARREPVLEPVVIRRDERG
jgi:hypothetical protein